MVEIVRLNERTTEEWAEQITAHWRKSIEAVIATGNELLAAKSALQHGEWLLMVDGMLPFSSRTAQALMQIARNPVIADQRNHDVLPQSWGTLVELARLDTSYLSTAISDGKITADISRSKVHKLVNQDIVVPNRSGCSVEQLDDLRGGGFGCVLVDPPWPYEQDNLRGSAQNHYNTMSVAEIAALPVGELVASKAHLHLWTTSSFLVEALEVMGGWGFEYKSQLVWTKPTMGMGKYWRMSHEILLLGVRGSLQFRDNSQMSWQEHPRGRHSEKPSAFREMVEKVSPGPYLELFARQKVDGWTVWGNEVD